MVLWKEWVIVTLCFSGIGASSGEMGLERIDKCATHCSQHLHCKSKPKYFFPPPCQNPNEGLNTSTVFNNVSLSTVMRCTGRQKCSLHLKITTHLQLTDSIHGLSFCTATRGLIMSCQSVSFTKASRLRMSRQQVTVANDCADVLPNQQLHVTINTMPSFCGITWTDVFYTPGCSSHDLSSHIPECITGQLSYSENPEKKELSVSVSGMLDDHDYNLRLCYKSFICSGTGSHILIKKEEPVKKAILSYSQPLPCLCIEGWSDVMDARRVQLCPFKDRIEELWTGITFNPFEDTLMWETACPVSAVVSLCQNREDGICVDLPQSSQNSSNKKISFTGVDSHPKLCMKFTIGSQSWTKCPFADSFQAWNVEVMTQKKEIQEVEIWSQVNGEFSLELCEKSTASLECHPIGTHYMHVEKQKVSKVSIATEQCNFCLKVKRLNVKYSVATNRCFNLCSESPDLSNKLNWILVPVGVGLPVVIVITLVLHLLLTGVKQKKKSFCSWKRQTDPTLNTALSATQTTAVLQKEVLIPASPQSGNTEKKNLILK